MRPFSLSIPKAITVVAEFNQATSPKPINHRVHTIFFTSEVSQCSHTSPTLLISVTILFAAQILYLWMCSQSNHLTTRNSKHMHQTVSPLSHLVQSSSLEYTKGTRIDRVTRRPIPHIWQAALIIRLVCANHYNPTRSSFSTQTNP